MRFLAPVDGRAGGTWIAATGLGSVLALLNKSGGRLPAAALSRGTLIPALVPCREPEALVATCAALPLARFAPFRLAADPSRIARRGRDPAVERLRVLHDDVRTGRRGPDLAEE